MADENLAVVLRKKDDLFLDKRPIPSENIGENGTIKINLNCTF